jgi:heme A synthase
MNDELNAAAALLAQRAAYHHHKENLAHLGAATYVGAAAAFVLSSRPADSKLHWTALLLLILTGVLGWFYVAWQLRRRDEAARIVQNLHEFIARRLPTEERDRVRATTPDTRVPAGVILVVMAGWAAWGFYVALRRAGCIG